MLYREINLFRFSKAKKGFLFAILDAKSVFYDESHTFLMNSFLLIFFSFRIYLNIRKNNNIYNMNLFLLCIIINNCQYKGNIKTEVNSYIQKMYRFLPTFMCYPELSLSFLSYR